MLLTWFCLVAFMLAAYVVLDGFDLGVGALHLLLARTEEERRLVLRAIAPVWDGNEVWLLAGGGTLYFAFPRLYASAFSGFYLPLMIVLWLLVLRGIGIELRGQVDSPVWRGFFDGCFGLGSALLCVFYGAALANVLRGVPLQKDGYFFLPLWTDWRAGASPGVLDWYTVVGGVVALLALSRHGALYLALKTEGALYGRARLWAARLWPLVIVLSAAALAATLWVRPALLDGYRAHPALYAVPAAAVAALFAGRSFERAGREQAAFVASSAFLAAMLGGAAAAVYPNLLLSSTDAALNVTVENAHSGAHSLEIGLIWWGFGMLLAAAYTVFVYASFRGKVAAPGDAHGY